MATALSAPRIAASRFCACACVCACGIREPVFAATTSRVSAAAASRLSRSRLHRLTVTDLERRHGDSQHRSGPRSKRPRLPSGAGHREQGRGFQEAKHVEEMVDGVGVGVRDVSDWGRKERERGGWGRRGSGARLKAGVQEGHAGEGGGGEAHVGLA